MPPVLTPPTAGGCPPSRGLSDCVSAEWESGVVDCGTHQFGTVISAAPIANAAHWFNGTRRELICILRLKRFRAIGKNSDLHAWNYSTISDLGAVWTHPIGGDEPQRTHPKPAFKPSSQGRKGYRGKILQPFHVNRKDETLSHQAMDDNRLAGP